MATKILRICFLGPRKAGKTSYIRALQNERYKSAYIPSDEVDISTVRYKLNCGNTPIIVSAWSINKPHKCIIEASHGVIGLFDTTVATSYIDLLQDLQKVSKPVVLVGTKTDSKNRILWPSHTGPYYEISAKEQYNLEYPMVNLLRLILKNNSIGLV
jgi:GTPase SAR1 family protein